MKRLIQMVLALIAGAWLLTVASLAHANSTYAFDASFSSGPLNGNTYTGLFVTDSNADNCYTPDDTQCSGELISFAISIGGFDFTSSTDNTYPHLPYVRLDGGEVTAIYFSKANFPYLVIEYDTSTSTPANFVRYIATGGGTISDGSIGNIRAVPLPPSLALISSGLALLGFFTRRRGTHQRRISNR